MITELPSIKCNVLSCHKSKSLGDLYWCSFHRAMWVAVMVQQGTIDTPINCDDAIAMVLEDIDDFNNEQMEIKLQ